MCFTSCDCSNMRFFLWKYLPAAIGTLACRDHPVAASEELVGYTLQEVCQVATCLLSQQFSSARPSPKKCTTTTKTTASNTIVPFLSYSFITPRRRLCRRRRRRFQIAFEFVVLVVFPRYYRGFRFNSPCFPRVARHRRSWHPVGFCLPAK